MIHPTAVIHPKASVADDATIGPYVIIGEDVRVGSKTRIGAHAILEGPDVIIGSGNEIGSHANIKSHTTLGDCNTIMSFACIGAPPQDLKFKGESSRLEIGNHNIFRENVTVNRGTAHGGSITRVGDYNFIMAYVHIAHDCQIGNHVVIANSVALAGHVEIEDCVIVGGMVGISQFCRIGTFVYLGGFSKISKDIPPYMIASGRGVTVGLRGVNSVGLKRKGVSSDVIRSLKEAFKILFISELTLQEGLARVKGELESVPEVSRLLAFIENSKQGIIGRGSGKDAGATEDSRHWRGISRELSH